MTPAGRNESSGDATIRSDSVDSIFGRQDRQIRIGGGLLIGGYPQFQPAFSKS